MGEPVPVERALDHVFGMVLVNDWSARDIQAWEYQPLGPFLGKSFATSISHWVVPIEELADRRVPATPQEPEPLPYLREEPWAFDIPLEVELNGSVVARSNTRHLYWSIAQQIAHLTVNGASLRTGDLLATGTISGPEREERGSLIELCWNGRSRSSCRAARPARSSRTATRWCCAASRSARCAADEPHPPHAVAER